MSRRRPTDGSVRAIALGYDRGEDEAPSVLASGAGSVAERILELANEKDIPIRQDEDLIACLTPLMVGESIPVEAFEAVARILAFLYELNDEGPEDIDADAQRSRP